MMNALATLCADHLAEEERLLTAALPMVRAISESLMHGEPVDVQHLLSRQSEIEAFLEEMTRRRQRLRETIANEISIPAADVCLSRVLERLPADAAGPLRDRLARVRALAEELAAMNYRLAVFVRIHLDAYRRLLCDLTGTASGSGRYGPQGKTEAPSYRPLIHIHG